MLAINSLMPSFHASYTHLHITPLVIKTKYLFNVVESVYVLQRAWVSPILTRIFRILAIYEVWKYRRKHFCNVWINLNQEYQPLFKRCRWIVQFPKYTHFKQYYFFWGGGGWHRGAHIPYPRFFTPQYPISQIFLPPISHIPDFLPPNIPYPRFHSQLIISQILQD